MRYLPNPSFILIVQIGIIIEIRNAYLLFFYNASDNQGGVWIFSLTIQENSQPFQLVFEGRRGYPDTHRLSINVRPRNCNVIPGILHTPFLQADYCKPLNNRKIKQSPGQADCMSVYARRLFYVTYISKLVTLNFRKVVLNSRCNMKDNIGYSQI